MESLPLLILYFFNAGNVFYNSLSFKYIYERLTSTISILFENLEEGKDKKRMNFHTLAANMIPFSQ